jgi:hypothetical protein
MPRSEYGACSMLEWNSSETCRGGTLREHAATEAGASDRLELRAAC